MNGQKLTIGLVIWTMLISSVLLNAVASLLLKVATIRLGTLWSVENGLLHNTFRIVFQPFIFGGLMCYVVSVALWIVVLSRVPVGMAYPMLSIGYVVNAIAGYLLFHEVLNTTQMVGIVVIIVGIFLVTRNG
jgi:multidrug transporter EmrE-like cation transporter